MKNTICEFLDNLQRLALLFTVKFVVSGVPATNIELGEFDINISSAYINFIERFNFILREEAAKRKLSFLDLYAMTNRGDGISNAQWHIESIHLKPSATQEAFFRYLLISD